MKGKGKSRTVTTYLPPELAAKLDALIAAEGGTRSGWLRAALEAYITDAEWTLACGLGQDLALSMGRDPEKVKRRIDDLRANPPPGYPGLSPRLRYEFDIDGERDARWPKGVNIISVPPWHEPPAETPLAEVSVCLSPERVSLVDGMIDRTVISRSALLRALLRFYLQDREREKRLIENEKSNRVLGITPEDVVRLVKEYRAERRAEKSE